MTGQPWVKDGFLGPDGARIGSGAHGAQREIDTGICVAGAAGCAGRDAVRRRVLCAARAEVFISGVAR